MQKNGDHSDSFEAHREVVVENPSGLHARPAAEFVQLAKQFTCDIMVSRSEQRASDAKSLTGVLTLGAGQGTKLELTAKGEDAREALDALEKLFEEGLEEE